MQSPIRGIVEKVRSSHAPCTVFEYTGRRARWFRWTMLSLRSLVHSFPFCCLFFAGVDECLKRVHEGNE